jgi:hopanoid-associated phosphorylase
VIVVVGLAFEARIAAGPGVRVICSGDGRNLAASLTRAIAEARTFAEGCQGLISFGVAGGLAPQLEPGACVVGSAILSGTARMSTDLEWSGRLLDTMPDAVHGMLVGVPTPISHPEAKRTLYLKTGAMAVDMESHIVGAVAAVHGLPFAAIRVITDPAVRALPKSALAAMRPDGTTDIAAMVRSIMQQPRELPALFRTALDARAARTTLLRGRQLLGPRLGLPEFSRA